MTRKEQKEKIEIQKATLYGFLVRYINEHQYPPTLTEMANELGVKDLFRVERLLAFLEMEDLIELDKVRSQRAVKLIGYKFVPET